MPAKVCESPVESMRNAVLSRLPNRAEINTRSEPAMPPSWATRRIPPSANTLSTALGRADFGRVAGGYPAAKSRFSEAPTTASAASI